MPQPCCADCAEREAECRGALCPYRPNPASPAIAEARLNAAAAIYALELSAQAWQDFLAAAEEYRIVTTDQGAPSAAR